MKNKNSKLIILSILVIANLVLGFKLASYVPILTQVRLELSLAKRDLLLLDKLAVDNLQYHNQLLRVLSTLPKTYDDVATLTYKIENVARVLGLGVEISYDKVASEKDGVLVLGVKIITTGGYQNYIKFLNSLSNLPYNTSVVNSSVVNESGNLTQTTIVNIYLRK